MQLRCLCVLVYCVVTTTCAIRIIQGDRRSISSLPDEVIVDQSDDIKPEVLEEGNFVGMTDPPDPVTWRSRFKVKAVCEDKMVVGISVIVWTPEIRVFQRVWRCYGAVDARSLRVRKVRLRLDDDIAFRPTVFNPKPAIVDMAKVVVWMMEEEKWAQMTPENRRDAHKWSSTRNSHAVTMLPPYSRPYKTLRRSCGQWYWSIFHTPRTSDVGVCPLQQTTVTILGYPVALNGQTYGFRRHVANYSDLDLDMARRQDILLPSFTVELWVYVKEYCPLYRMNNAKACMMFGHVTPDDVHFTPVLLIDNEGKIQVEVEGPGMYLARKSMLIIPRLKWVRIVFSLYHRKWKLEWSYDDHQKNVFTTVDLFDKDPRFDDTSGHFVIGGLESRMGTFHGYISRIKLYRSHVWALNELPLPSASDAMFTVVDTGQRDAECSDFMRWVQETADYYLARLTNKRSKHESLQNYKLIMTGHDDSNVLHSVPRRPARLPRGDKPVRNFLRLAVARYGHVTSKEATMVARQLLEFVIRFIEESGLSHIQKMIPVVNQSACLGDDDAKYTLAVFLNNGVGTSEQQSKSVSLLMEGVMKRHRLSTLAMGHRHHMGVDGVPFDEDVAYMYYKQVGDRTRDDRDAHPENQVATENIRLLDEKTLSQLTDEKGDIFMWLKHQAEQGVASAQSRLAHLYFWGSQGLRRNLQAARELFLQGEEQGDTDSLYNLAMMDIHGRGGANQNNTAGKERLSKAAEKKHPYAIGGLGWIALEQEKNYTKAAALFEEALQLNFVDAAYYLAHMHQWGLYPGLPKDTDKALYLYEWAAVRHHMVSGLMFALLKSKGTAKTPRHSYLAVIWARFIAEQNADIGHLLRKGVTAFRNENIPLAAYYYMLASEAGPEVASFNMAWLCEERKEEVAVAMTRECVWRHYNLSVHREPQFVDPYAYIKMGDYFWYGCQGHRNVTKAAGYYAAAGVKNEPHALFNLAFMVEEGADIPSSAWKSLNLSKRQYSHNITLLMTLYDRCRESYKSEAFIPCTLALYRVWFLHLRDSYLHYVLTTSFLGGAVAVTGTAYLMLRWLYRLRQTHPTLYRE